LEKIRVHRTNVWYWLSGDWSHFLGERNWITAAAAIFLVAAAVMFMYRPLSQAEEGDSATYDYMAQSVLRGQVLYRDVVDNKAPGSLYLSALAMQLGKALGLRDLIAARMLHVVLAGLLAVLVYLVAEAYLRNRIAAIMACLFPLMSDRFALWVVGGGQPKLPMILFGMLTLLLVAKDSPFWAGVSAMLSCLCWQPGLLFAGTAFLIFSRYLTTWRDLRAAKVLAGAAIPLLILLSYFHAKGAFEDLWGWTVTFNYSVYGPRSVRGVDSGPSHLLRVALKIFRSDAVLVVLSFLGLALYAVRSMGERIKRRELFSSPDLYRDAIVIAPIVYLMFSIFKFNAGPYLIPFFPFIGIFAGYVLTECVQGTRADVPVSNHPVRAVLVKWLPKFVVATMVFITLYRGAIYQFEPRPTLQDQDRAFEVVSRILGSNERMYVHGTAELLVLLNRPNLNPYVYLDWGKDDVLATRREGGFGDVIGEIESQAPKIVAISRLQKVAHRGELTDWVAKHYEPLEVPGYEGIYLRKEN